MSDSTIKLEIFRYHPEDGKGPDYQTYEVPYNTDWVVLDAINYIKDHIDGTLSHRWSCRMGVCGSCGMMVDGKAELTCHVQIKRYSPGDTIRVEPLNNFPVIRDLAVEVDDFVEKVQSLQPWLSPEEDKPPEEGEYRQSPAQLAAYKQQSMCINCMLCYAACPVYGLDDAFVGPAAIALGHRYNEDSRDGAQAERLGLMGKEHGVWDCTFVGECSVVCPKDVDPAGAIQRSKVATAKQWVRNLIMPGGNK